MKQRVVKVEVEVSQAAELGQAFPDRLADDLGDPLIVPSTRAAEVPFGMKAEKVVHGVLLSVRLRAELTYWDCVGKKGPLLALPETKLMVIVSPPPG
jgi:hypothetical protein